MRSTRNKTNVVAIDGPASSGKSSVAKYLAAMLGFNLLYSGKYYRVCGYAASSLSMKEPREIANMFRKLNLSIQDGKVLLHGKDVMEIIEGTRGDSNSMWVAKMPEVREVVNEYLLALHNPPGIVAEGRDMCNVFNNSARYYLDVDAHTRAEWRSTDRGTDLEVELASIEKRDTEDRKNLASPFMKHPEAATIPAGNMPTAQRVAEFILQDLKARAFI